ncbi:MAG: helix-turn-helix domain-containing protein [Capsulimonadaceae bacterium]
MSDNRFGEHIKRLRLDRDISLRAFCAASGVESSNYSKMERGLLPPPSEPAKLEPFRIALGLPKDDPEWRELTRLASIDRGEIPRHILTDKELVGKLPAFFRTLEGDPVDEDTLNELIAAIRREYNSRP